MHYAWQDNQKLEKIKMKKTYLIISSVLWDEKQSLATTKESQLL